MSHPDPLFDPDNAYEDDDMVFHDEENYDDRDDFYDEENSGQIDWEYDDHEDMDGDHDSAMTSCGWGTDEDYGLYGDYEDFHSDDGLGFYDDGE